MRPVRLAAVIGALLILAFDVSCGGSVEDDPSGGQTGERPGESTPSANATPYGSFELVSLVREKGRRATEVHSHFYLELKADGKAIARFCTRPYYDSTGLTLRCTDSLAYDCVYGTVKKEDATWRIEFVDLEFVRADDRGEIAILPNGGIVVRHMIPNYAEAEFVRISTEPPPTQMCSGR